MHKLTHTPHTYVYIYRRLMEVTVVLKFQSESLAVLADSGLTEDDLWSSRFKD